MFPLFVYVMSVPFTLSGGGLCHITGMIVNLLVFLFIFYLFSKVLIVFMAVSLAAFIMFLDLERFEKICDFLSAHVV